MWPPGLDSLIDRVGSLFSSIKKMDRIYCPSIGPVDRSGSGAAAKKVILINEAPCSDLEKKISNAVKNHSTKNVKPC